MRKILLTVLAVAGLTYASKAQTFGFQQGDVILEGAVQIKSTDNKTTEFKTNSFSVTPKVGYFVSDKAAVGFQVGYKEAKDTKYSGTNDTYTKANELNLGIFGRYYFLEVGPRFKAYGEAALGYSTVGGETGVGTTTVKLDNTNGLGFNGGIGANFFLTEKIALGYQFANVIGYSSAKLDKDGAKSSDSFYLNLNSFNNFFNSGEFSLTFKL